MRGRKNFADDIHLDKAAKSSPLLDKVNNIPTIATASAAETDAAAAAGQQLVSGTERLLVNIRDLLQTLSLIHI